MRKPRKLLVAAAALLLPVSTVTLVLAASSSPAFAFPAIGPCPVAATITFAPPGLSTNGAVNYSKTDNSRTSAATITSCGSSSLGPLTITSKAGHCSASGPVPGCAKHEYYYDTFTQFGTAGPVSIKKSLKTTTLTLDGNRLTTHTKKAFAIFGTAPCPGEVGFEITGKVISEGLYKKAATTLVACLGSDTGPGTTGSFVNDFKCSSCTIQTATVDASHSYVFVAAPKAHGSTTCAHLSGTITGGFTLSGCIGKGTSDAGGGSATGSSAALATGGTVTWHNGETTTVAAPSVKSKTGTHCPGYVKGGSNNPSLVTFTGAVTADSNGLKVPGKFKGKVCVTSSGNLSNVGPVKVT